MGRKSARGMGPAFTVQKVFKGSAARANAQTEISKLIAPLDPTRKEAVRRMISQAWEGGGSPQGVYDFVVMVMEAYHEKDKQRRAMI